MNGRGKVEATIKRQLANIDASGKNKISKPNWATSALGLKLLDFSFNNGLGETPWLTFAESQLGVHEETNNNDGASILIYQKSAGLNTGDAWCGAFVCWSLYRAGIECVKCHGWALNWSNYGQNLDSPAYGCIGTLRRPGGGHVGFVVGIDGERANWVIMLGGNQSNCVSYRSFPVNIMHFNYPNEFSPSYFLPTFTGIPRGVRMQ